ncbi:hypothetical protein LWI29_023543 [Acer saccharum]|uniref:Putative plant transposon protein domain-containing protein n=1 Tax=Acer saccharum TaxID=4024 RepID=A0AA39SWU2_ACESA|nr:hypothetical protein LWI29_023543 [Acer saccharum]
MNRPIIYEKGIQVSTPEGTSIPTIVEARKLENFVMSRGLAIITLVREFFASMVPETFRSRGCVLVRNVVVEISENKINEHFGTTPVRQSTLPLGYAPFNGDSEKLAKLLRGNEDGVWTKKHPIRQSNISKDMALMNLFNSASLRPVSHTGSISVNRAELIACYLTRGPIDVGRVIRAELNEMAKGEKGDLNLRFWNDTTSKTKGRMKLWRLPSFRSRADSEPEEFNEEDEDFEPQEEELHFGDSGQAGSSEMSQFDQIMKAIAGNKLATE